MCTIVDRRGSHCFAIRPCKTYHYRTPIGWRKEKAFDCFGTGEQSSGYIPRRADYVSAQSISRNAVTKSLANDYPASLGDWTKYQLSNVSNF